MQWTPDNDPLTLIAGRLEPITANAPIPAGDRLHLGMAMALALEEWPEAKTWLRENGRGDCIPDLQRHIDTMRKQPPKRPPNFAAMEAARLLILELKTEAASIARVEERKLAATPAAGNSRAAMPAEQLSLDARAVAVLSYNKHFTKLEQIAKLLGVKHQALTRKKCPLFRSAFDALKQSPPPPHGFRGAEDVEASSDEKRPPRRRSNRLPE